MIPMQHGMCVRRYFDPVFSTTLPLDWKEFDQAVAEVDGVLQAALPIWMRALRLVLPFSGFVLFLLGMLTMMSSMSFTGPPLGAIVCVLAGFFLFAGGSIGMTCCLSARTNQAVSDVRRKLSELNARYAHKGVDFQLHESRHLEFYNGTSQSRGGVRTVKDYTLVVQALDANASRSAPAPDVLRETFQPGFTNIV
jgi:hypothetical protein